MQERVESSLRGRQFLSVVLVLTVAAIILWNMPQSEIRTLAEPVVGPFVHATGLDQRWNLFAPNPPKRTYQVSARIEYADGSQALWRPPRNDRWRKWLGVIRTERSRRLWEPTAAWIARHHDAGGRRTESVELIVRHRDLLPPGSGLPEHVWSEDVFYTYDVPAAPEQ